MKKCLILLTVVLIVLLSSCNNSTQNLQKTNSTFTELSEVESYFSKSLNIDIQKLYYFRFYDFSQTGLGVNLIQYAETKDSPLQYLSYLSYRDTDSNSGEVKQVSETETNQPISSNYTVSQLSFSTMKVSDLSFYYIIKETDGKIGRLIIKPKSSDNPDSTTNVCNINYNKNGSVSDIDLITCQNENNIYDMNSDLSDDYGFFTLYYDYNSDGSLKQATKKYFVDDTLYYEFTYDEKGNRIRESFSDGDDESSGFTEYERNNSGTITRVYDEHENKKLDNSIILERRDNNITIDNSGLFILSNNKWNNERVYR